MGYVGFVPSSSEAPVKLLEMPSEADIGELYTALELDAQGQLPSDDSAAASKAGSMVYQLQARLNNPDIEHCSGADTSDSQQWTQMHADVSHARGAECNLVTDIN